jgi:hypothetical protein
VVVVVVGGRSSSDAGGSSSFREGMKCICTCGIGTLVLARSIAALYTVSCEAFHTDDCCAV